jgi:N6-adenosine-specific RNA methylase IME4
MTEVQVITAKWCKRCTLLKPEIERICTLIGAKLSYIDYDTLEEYDELRTEIVSLPTLRLSTDGGTLWKSFTANTFEEWKQTAMATCFAIDSEF